MRLSIFSKIGGGVLAALVLIQPMSAAAMGHSSVPAVRSLLHTRFASAKRDVASTNGRADGRKAGISDKRKHLPKNYASHSEYQNGMRGYKPRMGSPEVYKRSYQAAFENGYEDGWNGY